MSDETDFLDPRNSLGYKEWKADGIATAAQIQSKYDDKVTVHFNETPSEANFIITIGVLMDSQAITLLRLRERDEYNLMKKKVYHKFITCVARKSLSVLMLMFYAAGQTRG